jgi:hypothetical protein
MRMLNCKTCNIDVSPTEELDMGIDAAVGAAQGDKSVASVPYEMIISHCPKCDAVLERRRRHAPVESKLASVTPIGLATLPQPGQPAPLAQPGNTQGLLIDQLRARLIDVDATLAQVAALKAERKRIVAMIKIAERGT